MLHGRGYHEKVQIEVWDGVDTGWFVAVGIPAERKVIEGHLGGGAIATGQSQLVHSAENGGGGQARERRFGEGNADFGGFAAGIGRYKAAGRSRADGNRGTIDHGGWGNNGIIIILAASRKQG